MTKEQRSYCMSRIRSKNTGIEREIFRRLNIKGVKYKKHYKIIGKPDVAFPEHKIAVFIDSDFWHGWQYPRWSKRLPNNYWRDRIERNRQRDLNNFAKLRDRGWKVIRIWGHAIKQNPDKCTNIILGIAGYKKRQKQ